MTATLPAHHTRCPQCDLEVALPGLAEGQKADCPRCGETLCALPVRVYDSVMAWALCALFFLTLSLSFPLMALNVEGVHQQITLLGSADALLKEDFTLLSDVLVLAVLLIPALFLTATLYVYGGLRRDRYLIGMRSAAQLALACRPWMMADVFLLAILVSVIKLASLADVSLGKAFWAMMLFALALTRTVSLVNGHWLLMELARVDARTLNAEAAQGFCPHCGAPHLAGQRRCTRCFSTLSRRRAHSVQLTLAFLVTAIVLYVPANLYPIMVTEYLGKSDPSTILQGVLLLWQLGSYPVALVILIASVLIPIAKFLALILLLIASRHPFHDARRHTQLYRVVEFIGRWSMVDVFVVSLMVALVQMGQLMSIYPGVAALSFAGMVVFTMLAAMCFDVRLVWDAELERPRND